MHRDVLNCVGWSWDSVACERRPVTSSPHMHQERVMSKASAGRNSNITLKTRTNQTLSVPHVLSSSYHPNTITAGCPTASGNSDTLCYSYTSRTRSLQHFRPRQLRDEIWLQHEPSFFSVWVRISTHRVGIVGIGPWPSSPGAPGWKDQRRVQLHSPSDNLKGVFYSIEQQHVHVHSWHARTHCVVWGPHASTEVLKKLKQSLLLLVSQVANVTFFLTREKMIIIYVHVLNEEEMLEIGILSPITKLLYIL